MSVIDSGESTCKYLFDSRRYPKESYELGSVRPSFRPSILRYKRFLGIGSLVFYKFWYGVRSPVNLSVTEPEFLKKKFCPQNEPKIGFFESIGKFSYYFFLNLVSNESLCYLLYS